MPEKIGDPATDSESRAARFRGTLQYVSSVGAVTGGYALVGAAALVRIPITIGTIGVDSFGVVLAIGVAWPLVAWLLYGIVRGTRIHLAETAGSGDDLASEAAQLSRDFKPVLSGGLVLALMSLALPSERLLGAGNLVAAWEIRGALGITIAAAAICVPGALRLGALESIGRVRVFPLSGGVVSIVGAAAAVGLAKADAGVFAFSVLNVVTSAVPFAVVWYITGSHLGDQRQPTSGRRSGVVSRFLLLGLPSLADFLKGGIDPLILVALATPASAVSWTVAQRLSLVTTVTFTASAPLIAVSLARVRTMSGIVGLRRIAKLSVMQGSIAAVAAIGLVLIGPMVGEFLQGSEQDTGLYVAFGILGVAWSIEEVLRQSAAGSSVSRIGGAISIVAVGVNLGLSLALARTWGATGVVWASVVATAITVVGWAAMLWLIPSVRGERVLP